jgi:hypothetical protein
MILQGKSVKKSVAQTVKLQAADLATKATVKIDLGSPSILATTALTSALTATTHTNAFQLLNDGAAAGSIVIPASTDLISEIVTAIDGTAGLDAVFVAGDTSVNNSGRNSYILVSGAVAASTSAGSNWSFGSSLTTLLTDISAKLGFPVSKVDAENGVFDTLTFTPASAASKQDTKGVIYIDLGSNSYTAATVMGATAAAVSSDIVSTGYINATYTLTLAGTETLISNVVTSLDATSGVTATFVPGDVGVSAKIKIELDTAGESILDASNLTAASELISVLDAAFTSSTVTLGTVTNGTSAFDNFAFTTYIKSSAGVNKSLDEVTSFDRSLGRLTIKSGATTNLTAGDVVTYIGQFVK